MPSPRVTLRWLVVSVLTVLALSSGGTAEGEAAPRKAAVTALPTDTDVDYQLGGAVQRPSNVGIIARDRTEAPAEGRYNICYINGYQTQDSEKGFWKRHRDLLLHRADGTLVVDEGWGEWLFDIRTSAKRAKLAKIVGRWISGCARDGFDADEFDNFDSFTRSEGLMTREQALAFAKMLIRRSHAAGLAVGQKNLAGFDGTKIGFDYVVSESCARYDECDRYVQDFGDQVLMIEYRRGEFKEACEEFGELVPIVLRDRDLSPKFKPSYC